MSTAKDILEMPYRQWILNRELSKARKRQLENTRKKINLIVAHSLTIEKQIGDFPEIQKYLESKFPKVDISDIKIYVADPDVVHKAGWKDIGGCYVHVLKVILVKSKIENKKVRGKFKKLIQDSCHIKVDVEDVVVHELIHAVSHRINRASSRYVHMEEEFVYTNCIDFYKQKGMTEDDIVNNNFLPFCIADVYSCTEEMSCIFAQVGHSLLQIREMNHREYTAFLNKHAETIVPLIKEKAQKKAHHMIELYHKYGSEMYQTSSIDTAENSTSLRFSTLDLGEI